MLGSVILAFTLTVGIILLLRPIALRLGYVDRPMGHKTHQGEVPIVGGIAMYCGLLLAILVFPGPIEIYRSLLATAFFMVFIGVLDDFNDLSRSMRAIMQVFAAILMVYWGEVRLLDLGDLVFSGPVELQSWSVVFTVFAAVGVINATNMIDGMDGLAGSVLFVGLGGIFLLGGGWTGTHPLLPVIVIMLSVLAAFLIFNLKLKPGKRATIFMGNSGSLFLGVIMAWVLIGTTQSPGAVLSPVTALWLFAVPLFDTVSVMLRRPMSGASPFTPDQRHIHHFLRKKGLTSQQSVFVLILFSMLMATVGISAHWLRVSEGTMFTLFLGLFAIFHSVLTFADRSTDSLN